MSRIGTRHASSRRYIESMPSDIIDLHDLHDIDPDAGAVLDPDAIERATALIERSAKNSSIVTVPVGPDSEDVADVLHLFCDDSAEEPFVTEFWGGDEDPWRVHVRHHEPDMGIQLELEE